MKAFIQFTLPTGHVFELSAKAVADDRAAYYFKHRPDEFKTLEEAQADTVGLFDDDFEVRDWLFNNMDVDATMLEHGRLIAFNPPAHDWNEAESSHHDAPAPFTPIAADQVFEAPVELLVSEMASANEVCSVRLMNGTDDGEPHQALALVAGGPAVVNRYITALQITTDLLAKEMAAAASARH